MDPRNDELLRCFHMPGGAGDEDLDILVDTFEELALDYGTRFAGPNAAKGLRRLLEARDCFIRAHVMGT
jgi:hypothetical protein